MDPFFTWIFYFAHLICLACVIAGGVAARFIFFSIAEILHDEHPQEWEQYGRPLFDGTPEKGLAARIATWKLMTGWVFVTPEWMRGNEKARTRLRFYRRTHLGIVITAVVSLGLFLLQRTVHS